MDLRAKVKTPHYTLIIILSFAGASPSTGSLSHPKMHQAHWGASAMESGAVSVSTAVLTTDFLPFATLWQVQVGVSSQVTWVGNAGGEGECGHGAVHLRACSRSGSERRDAHLCGRDVGTLYLLWMVVTTFLFRSYNRSLFKKHTWLHAWTISPQICGFAVLVC